MHSLILDYDLLLFIVLTLWIVILWSRRKFYKLMLSAPGPIGLPIIGIVHKIYSEKTLIKVLVREANKFRSDFLTWLGPVPLLVICNADTVQDILTNPNTETKSKNGYEVLHQFTGNGLVAINGQEWKRHRKAINPAFRQNVLVDSIPFFNTESDLLTKDLKTMVGKGEHDLIKIFENFILAISIRSFWGVDIMSDEDYKNYTLLHHFKTAVDMGTTLFLCPWLNNKVLRKLCGFEKAFTIHNAAIRNKIKMNVDKRLDANSIDENPSTFLNLIIEQMKAKNLSYQDVIDEAYTVSYAALETTALSIEFALMYLAMYPEYQEKLFEELNLAFPNKEKINVTYENLQELSYLDLVFKETLRLMPSISFFARKVTNEFKLSNGIVLPKGLEIMISPYVIHRNKSIWGPDADIFNPDNFLPDNIKEKHPFAYIPFSRGLRNCIGSKFSIIVIKITLIKLLRNYKFSSNFRDEEREMKTSLNLTLYKYPKFELEHRM